MLCPIQAGAHEAHEVRDSGRANYAVDVRFPVDYPDQQALIDAITKERGGFIDWVAQSVPRSFPYELNIVGHPYRSGTPSAGTQSLVFHVGSDTGVHPVTTYKARSTTT
jgi:hypothetical protein